MVKVIRYPRIWKRSYPCKREYTSYGRVYYPCPPKYFPSGRGNLRGQARWNQIMNSYPNQRSKWYQWLELDGRGGV